MTVDAVPVLPANAAERTDHLLQISELESEQRFLKLRAVQI
jgi:hypothetical protein